jgi:hypothetical protein
MIMAERLYTVRQSGQLAKSTLTAPPHTPVHGYRMLFSRCPPLWRFLTHSPFSQKTEGIG